MQLTLHAPAITCDHCIATIRKHVEGVEGARFLSGDAGQQSSAIEVDGGQTLDRVSAVLTEIGYPPSGAPAPAGDTPADETPDSAADPRSIGWTPAYRVTSTERGADINYDCYCGCDAGFALDRSAAAPEAEGCCCGNRILAGAGAGDALTAHLDASRHYRIDLQQVTGPWGGELEVALAIPAAG